MEKHNESSVKGRKKLRVSRQGLLGIVDSLESAVSRLKWRSRSTEWGDYYNFTNYSDVAMNSKKKFFEEALDTVKPKTVWDLGANTVRTWGINQGDERYLKMAQDLSQLFFQLIGLFLFNRI